MSDLPFHTKIVRKIKNIENNKLLEIGLLFFVFLSLISIIIICLEIKTLT